LGQRQVGFSETAGDKPGVIQLEGGVGVHAHQVHERRVSGSFAGSFTKPKLATAFFDFHKNPHA